MGSFKVGENGSLRYVISWFKKSRYEDIRYLFLIEHEPNESKDIQSVGLTRASMKILVIYLSYNMNLMYQNNYYEAITNIHGILKL